MTPLGAESKTRDNLSFTIAGQKNESQKCNPMYVYDGNYTLHTSQFILNKNKNIVPSSIPKRRRAVVEMARKRAGDRPNRAASKKQDADDESLSLESL